MMDSELIETIKQALIKVVEAFKAICDAFKDFIRPIFAEIYNYEVPKSKRYSRNMNIIPKKYIIPDKRNRVFYCRNNC